MKLNYIGQYVDSYPTADFEDFKQWILPLKVISHDVESNVVPSILDRELRVLQYADKHQVWVLQWSYLTDEQKQWIINLMNESHRKYVIHSVTFEYTLWKKYGVVLKNVWDTYRKEQILNTGKGSEEGSYNLESIIFKRFGITLSKEMQLQFGDDIMTTEKILYAAGDVANGIDLMELQQSDMIAFDKGFIQPDHKGLKKTSWWDDEFCLVAGDMEYNGMLLDVNKWSDCYNVSYPKTMEAKEKLDKIVTTEFREWAIAHNYYSTEPRFESLWNSSNKKQALLSLVFPDIEKTTKLDLKEYLRDHDPDFPEVVDTVAHKNTPDSVVFPLRKLKITGKEWEKHDYPYDLKGKWGILKALIIMNKETEEMYTSSLNRTFYKNYREFMIEREYVIPENTLSLNWGSSQQKLELFKMINPAIDSTNAETVDNNLLTHPIFQQYKEYQETATLITKFGMDYLKHIQRDGRIRTVFNTVLATGRISAKEPNLLQLPRNKDYRACFIAPQGYKIVDADYEAEELCFIAILSKEPVWLEALNKNHDLHSINAELLYEGRWHEATLPDCAYVTNKQKCKCPKHKEMRTTSKTLSFGLSYGLSSYGFAARNHITEDEAKRLINKFFGKYKMIHQFLSRCGRFGVQNNFIYESGTGRVRYFDAWKTAKKQDWDGSWIYANEAEMQGVMRAAMNFPIQSLGASVLKIACVLIRRWINHNNLQDLVQIALPPHDEILLYAREEFAEEAASKLEHYMQLAGKLVLKTDLLRAKATIDDYWKKD